MRRPAFSVLKNISNVFPGNYRAVSASALRWVRKPQVFLFDEPLSNLDAKLRVQMRTEIRELHQRLKTTSVYVTHDQIEAMTMADKIVVMNGGHVEQIGSPLDLYDYPANLFVAGFIGSPAMNFLHGSLVTTTSGRAVRLAPDCTLAAGPTEEPDGRKVVVEAEVIVTEPTGADTQVFCRMAGREVAAISRERHLFAPTTRIRLDVMEGKACLFDPETGQRL